MQRQHQEGQEALRTVASCEARTNASNALFRVLQQASAVAAVADLSGGRSLKGPQTGGNDNPTFPFSHSIYSTYKTPCPLALRFLHSAVFAQ